MCDPGPLTGGWDPLWRQLVNEASLSQLRATMLLPVWRSDGESGRELGREGGDAEIGHDKTLGSALILSSRAAV